MSLLTPQVLKQAHEDLEQARREKLLAEREHVSLEAESTAAKEAAGVYRDFQERMESFASVMENLLSRTPPGDGSARPLLR